MIKSAGKKIQFHQSFSLPQSDTYNLRDGDSHRTSEYGGEDVILMDADTFMEEIVEVGSFYDPCTLIECDFMRNIDTLDSRDNYSTQKRRCIVLHQNHFFMKL